MQYDDIITKSRWRTAAILKIALFPYLSRELSDFGQIWYADEYFHSEDGHLTENIEILHIQDGGRTQYGNFFFYVSVPFWTICAKFA